MDLLLQCKGGLSSKWACCNTNLQMYSVLAAEWPTAAAGHRNKPLIYYMVGPDNTGVFRSIRGMPVGLLEPHVPNS
jgi:hypothetical protein